MFVKVLQALETVVDGYFLAFAVLAGIYGLIVDVKELKGKGNDFKRDAKIVKNIYIVIIVIGVISYSVPRIL